MFLSDADAQLIKPKTIHQTLNPSDDKTDK